MTKKILYLSFLLSIKIMFAQQKSINNLHSYPNPFKGNTEISFNSTKEQGVYLIIKNIIGKTVFTKTYWTQKGKRKIIFKGKDLKPGMYIYSIQSDSGVISKRFIINK